MSDRPSDPALRILLVEDDALIGMLLADMLAGMGHAVVATETNEEGAVAAALRERPDLVLMDARLQQGSGLSAMARILQSGPVAHVFISGAPVRTANPDAVVLQKPFLEPELIRAIARALAVARRS